MCMSVYPNARERVFFGGGGGEADAKLTRAREVDSFLFSLQDFQRPWYMHMQVHSIVCKRNEVNIHGDPHGLLHLELLS